MLTSPDRTNSLDLREGIVLDELLDGHCRSSTLKRVDSLIAEKERECQHSLSDHLARQIADRLPISGNPWPRIQQYCTRRLGNPWNYAPLLVEAIIELFQPSGTGAWIGPDVVDEREPKLKYDDDDLLVGPASKITFTKEGVLTKSSYLLYASHVEGACVSGGFVDELLKVRNRLDEVENFGLAINPHVVLEESYYGRWLTRAYIRGPRGISSEQLNSSDFPEDPSGTVTVHQDLLSDRYQSSLNVPRLEVMWSLRDGVKSVQIEELVPPTSTPEVSNRYVHARWDPSRSVFIHVDGAARIYETQEYAERLATDLRKFDGGPACYSKAFRLDGELSLKDWCELVTKFYATNKLVLEYLGGPRDER